MSSILVSEVPSSGSGHDVPTSGRPPRYDSNRDLYRGVVIVLTLASILGTAGAVWGGVELANPVLFDMAVTLGFAAGILIGVAVAQATRAVKPQSHHEVASVAPPEQAEATEKADVSPTRNFFGLASRIRTARVLVRRWSKNLGLIGMVRIAAGTAGALAIGFLLLLGILPVNPAALILGITAAIFLGGAGLAATAARYLSEIEPTQFPEAPGLCRGARMVGWILVIGAISIGLEWIGARAIMGVLHFIMLIVNVQLCYSLFTATQPETEVRQVFPLDLGISSILGSRANILGSILDSAERQLGIDLRSTWALTVVRRSLEPLLIGLFLLGWLSTSLTVVGVQDEGLVERLGVPVLGRPLGPGLHLHWPWPVDQVFRIPVQRVQMSTVGHEGQEEGGPENVLWAVEHAPNEYTLLLGNGRDLITVDAAVQYRISDPRAWRYHSQNPADALRAIAYRAVMRNTVNRTLSETLSENVVAMTGRMRVMVQQDADALGLGIDVVGFTVGGMHPPVPVASDYEAVVSAELGKVTSVANAQAFRNQTVPAAEASVLTSENTARADGAEALGRAAGEAWSFRALESQYRASPQEYFFRRRLEILENGLGGRSFTVVDSRFQRDGGELWLIP